MRRSLSHRYQQGQSLIQLGAISFFDDRSQVGAGGDFLDFSAALSPCPVVDLATSLLPSRSRTQEPPSSNAFFRHKC
jgi:hypothetical protein